MGTLHQEMWLSEGSGRSRKERKSGSYSYYLPTKLANLAIALPADVINDVSNAERAISSLNAQKLSLRSFEGVARLLLRAESVSSSHIEGLTVGAKRLLKAEINLAETKTFKHDKTATEIVGNIHAMEQAIYAAQECETITRETILDIHKRLCASTRIEHVGGVIRDKQNWVGGNSYNPLDAEFIPPAPEYVADLLDDLAGFCNRTDISPIIQAALVHAQFESIHPFMDGNGRTGRALIHLVLRRRKLAPNLVPPISLIMATHSKSYVQALTNFRFLDSDIPESIQEGITEWISFFAGVCVRACEEALLFEESADRLREKWVEKLSGVRKNSALDLLLREMVGMPLFSIQTACTATGRSFSSVSTAIEKCIQAGIVKPSNAQKRNRTFEVPDALREFNILERKLASPIGDTRIEKPTRAVPENTSKTKQ